MSFLLLLPFKGLTTICTLVRLLFAMNFPVCSDITNVLITIRTTSVTTSNICFTMSFYMRFKLRISFEVLTTISCHTYIVVIVDMLTVMCNKLTVKCKTLFAFSTFIHDFGVRVEVPRKIPRCIKTTCAVRTWKRWVFFPIVAVVVMYTLKYFRAKSTFEASLNFGFPFKFIAFHSKMFS